MARVVVSFQEPLTTPDGVVYQVHAAGRPRQDGTWEGWIEFEPHDGSTPLHTPRETTQPSLAALEYWAAGLTPVYLDGALARAVDAHSVTVATELVETPAYDAPAPARGTREEAPEPLRPEPEPIAPLADAVLDPFAVYARGEPALRERLGALGGRHLRGILVAYGFVEATDVSLRTLSNDALIELIVVGVRSRLAA